MLKFYYSPGSCARASHIALEEAGAVFEAIRVNLKNNEQRTPEYLAVNPKGRVPALATERGILTENVAILAFIAQSYPAARLAPPDDPYEFARIQAFNSYLSSTVHVAHAHKGRGSRWVDDEHAIEAMKKKVPQSVGDAFAMIERGMFVGPWVMGDQYTTADAYLFTLAQWMEGDGVDPARFPKVLDHRNRMAERDAVKRVLAVENA